VNGWTPLDDFLRTDPRDAGCEQAMALLHVYAELAADDPAAAARRQPGLAAHLRACGPCATDLEGLLQAMNIPDERDETLSDP
jgi:hypothetical protein